MPRRGIVRLLAWLAGRMLDAAGGAILAAIFFQSGSTTRYKLDVDGYVINVKLVSAWMIVSGYGLVTLLLTVAGNLDRTRYMFAHVIAFEGCLLILPIGPMMLSGAFWNLESVWTFGLLLVLGPVIVAASAMTVRKLAAALPGNARVA